MLTVRFLGSFDWYFAIALYACVDYCLLWMYACAWRFIHCVRILFELFCHQCFLYRIQCECTFVFVCYHCKSHCIWSMHRCVRVRLWVSSIAFAILAFWMFDMTLVTVCLWCVIVLAFVRQIIYETQIIYRRLFFTSNRIWWSSIRIRFVLFFDAMMISFRYVVRERTPFPNTIFHLASYCMCALLSHFVSVVHWFVLIHLFFAVSLFVFIMHSHSHKSIHHINQYSYCLLRLYYLRNSNVLGSKIRKTRRRRRRKSSSSSSWLFRCRRSDDALRRHSTLHLF